MVRICPVRKVGIHIADVLGAAISPPWDFPSKVLVTFFRFLGKWERVEQILVLRWQCRGCLQATFFKSNLADAELLSSSGAVEGDCIAEACSG